MKKLDPVSRIANERFLMYFMLPLFATLFLFMFAIGVGVLTGLVAVEGGRGWAWMFIAIPASAVLWVLWVGRK